MDMTLFRDLERLRETGNFSQAAQAGNLSQPAFSRRIKGLEAWAGVLLVDRSRQPVRLTEAGAQMLEAGLQGLAHIEHARSQIREAQALPDQYVVTFGAQHSIGWRFYPAWLQALEEAYGPILSRLRADDLPNCLQDLAEGDVDFVVAYGAETRGFSSLLIGRDRLIPVSKPGPDGAPLHRFGDTPLPFLRFGSSAPISTLLEPVFTRHGLNDRLQVVYENSMAGALRMRAHAGDGVAWLPESVVAPDLAAKLLVPTGDPAWDVPLEIRLYRNEARSNRVTRSLWGFLETRGGLLTG
ncbi:MAG: LysR family transcriptional regulator [Silicimonas sp.]|nr:LysR family transcriptional regulator [Silicimonas sp.]